MTNVAAGCWIVNTVSCWKIFCDQDDDDRKLQTGGQVDHSFFFSVSDTGTSAAEDVMAEQQKPQPTGSINEPLPPPPQAVTSEQTPPPSEIKREISANRTGKVLATPAVRKLSMENNVSILSNMWLQMLNM